MSLSPGWASRTYAGEADLLQMREMLMEARGLTGSDWSHAHVGLLVWDFFMIHCHLEPRRHIRLWHDAVGRLVGYAMLGDDLQFFCQVLPPHEWLGIEEDALAWVEALSADLRRHDPARWGGALVSGARQDDAARIAFLEERGFRYRGEFAEVDMIRSLDGSLPEPALPAGYVARALSPGEVGERAAAYREVWQPWTVGDVSDDDYAALMNLPGYRPDLDLVAIAPDGTIAAYVNCWLDPVNRIGDLGPVGARPAYRRQGLTRAVLCEGLRRLREAGMGRVCVSTGVTNAAARPLYESVGFRIVNQYLDYVR